MKEKPKIMILDMPSNPFSREMLLALEKIKAEVVLVSGVDRELL